MLQNANVSQSQPQLMRRHYPLEFDGAKNEWKAIIDHDTEADKFQHQQLDSMKQYKQKLQGDSKFLSPKKPKPKPKRLDNPNAV